MASGPSSRWSVWIGAFRRRFRSLRAGPGRARMADLHSCQHDWPGREADGPARRGPGRIAVALGRNHPRRPGGGSCGVRDTRVADCRRARPSLSRARGCGRRPLARPRQLPRGRVRARRRRLGPPRRPRRWQEHDAGVDRGAGPARGVRRHARARGREAARRPARARPARGGSRAALRRQLSGHRRRARAVAARAGGGTARGPLQGLDLPGMGRRCRRRAGPASSACRGSPSIWACASLR